MLQRRSTTHWRKSIQRQTYHDEDRLIFWKVTPSEKRRMLICGGCSGRGFHQLSPISSISTLIRRNDRLSRSSQKATTPANFRVKQMARRTRLLTETTHASILPPSTSSPSITTTT